MTTGRKRLIADAERANPVVPVHVWRSPVRESGPEVVVVAHPEVYAAIHRHVVAALPNETGGFLLGRVALDVVNGRCWHVEIDEALPVEPCDQTPAHFAFTWKDVDHVRTYREEHGKALVGWYHTHPNLGIFLSETDIERTHRVLFGEPFQVALVYDPVRGRAGYFQWDETQIIDGAPAEWREFAIAVQEEEPAVEPSLASMEGLEVVQAGAGDGRLAATDRPPRARLSESPSAEDDLVMQDATPPATPAGRGRGATATMFFVGLVAGLIVMFLLSRFLFKAV